MSSKLDRLMAGGPRRVGTEVLKNVRVGKAPPVVTRVEMMVDGADATCLAELPVRKQEWLWQGRVPLGHLTVLVGPRGAGKSYLAADLAARVTRGASWPDRPETAQPAGSVLWITGEDDPAKIVTPRLRASGADLRKVHAIDFRKAKAIDGGPYPLTDSVQFRDAASCITDLRLVIIDGFAATLGDTNDRRTDALASLLWDLADFADSEQVAIVVINANDKLSTGKTARNAMDVLPFLEAFARSVWAMEPDPGDPARMLWLPARLNLAADPGGLGFKIEPGTARVVWDQEPVALRANGTRPPSRSASGAARAATWLRGYLGGGARSADQILREGILAGHSRRSLYAAKAELGAGSTKETDRVNGPWSWSLPVVAEEPPPARPEVAKQGSRPEDSNIPAAARSTENRGSAGAEHRGGPGPRVIRASELVPEAALNEHSKQQTLVRPNFSG